MAAHFHHHHHHLPLCLLLLLLQLIHTAIPHASAVGINYGQVANNLPSPSSVIPLLRSIGATKVKLYDSDRTVLRAFAGTDIEFVVGLPDSSITKLAKHTSEALTWVKANILPYLPETKITAITVGNEVLTGEDTSNIHCLLPAMQSIHSALASLKLDHQIAVTTAHSLAVLGTSYPPSAGSFRSDITPYISQMLPFLAKTGSPFLINAYPYFAYKADPGGVQLDYVLFEGNSGVSDAKTGFKYDNMLYAQVDAIYKAIAAVMGEEKAKAVDVSVSETGWPSKGDVDEAGATVENARRYNGNLIRLVEDKKGTPLRPDSALEVYVFALFNENLKPGPASERNYGLFKPDGTPAYQLVHQNVHHATGGGGNSSTGGGGGSVAMNSTTLTPVVSGGFLTVSSASKVVAFLRFGSLLHLPSAMVGIGWTLFSVAW